MKNIINNVKKTATSAICKVQSFAQDTRGDLATNTIGAIIVGVVIVGLLITAVNSFFPSFFTDMFNAMETKLSGNW